MNFLEGQVYAFKSNGVIRGNVYDGREPDGQMRFRNPEGRMFAFPEDTIQKQVNYGNITPYRELPPIFPLLPLSKPPLKPENPFLVRVSSNGGKSINMYPLAV